MSRKSKTITPTDYITPFTQWLSNTDHAPLTVKNYGSDLRLFAAWFMQTNGQPLTPEALTPTDVRDYRAYLLLQQAAAATVNRKLIALTMFAKWAQAEGYIEFIPTDGVKLVAQQPLAPKWLDRREQNALVRQAQRELNAAKTEVKKQQALRDWAIVQLLLNTGLRASELCDLQMSQLVLKEQKGQIQVQSGKGTKQRIVPLNMTALKALKEWLKVRPKTTHPYVFTNSSDEALQSRGLQHRLHELGRLAKVEVTPHTLRHTFAKNLVDAGATLEKVAALLGHASLNTTRVYTTPSAMDLEKAVALVGE